jgi:creatinine amidohydrolase
MRPYVLSECHWKDLKNKKIDLAVLPWGATEAHNYHLPYGTDVYEADEIAQESGRIAYEMGAKIMILPTIPFGVNTGQRDIFLDMNIYPSTQQLILDNVIEVLHRQGIYKLVVFNSHGGNDFKMMLRELGSKYPKMLLCQTNWFKGLNKSLYFEEEGDHADEMETSLMMYFKPELVLPLSMAGDGAEKKNTISGFREGWAWMERPWSLISKDTGVGNPFKSNAEKGKNYFVDVTSKLGQFFFDLSVSNLETLYED